MLGVKLTLFHSPYLLFPGGAEREWKTNSLASGPSLDFERLSRLRGARGDITACRRSLNLGQVGISVNEQERGWAGYGKKE